MKVYLRTFGCRANQYDGEQVRAALAAGGAELVATPDEADAAVFNSCTVTGEAEAELRRAVRRAARSRPGLTTVIMGCAAARDRGELAALPSVAAVVPNAELPGVLGALGLPAPAGPVAMQTSARALLRIQDGCDEHCTFCATTLARGASRSRTPEALVAEARQLGATHPEIVLTGIHIGGYGREIGSSLGALLARLVAEVDGVRFRLSSVEATEVDHALAALLRDGGERVAPHLHAPLQSGSDALLRRMGRHWYTAGDYARAVERLVGGRGVFALGADVITGFPGETARDHAATVALVEALPFTYLHVFPYAPRPGTAATRLPDPVPAPLARERAAELRAVAERKARVYGATRLGGTADVVVVRGGAAREGLTEDYLSVRPAAADVPRRTRYAARLAADGDALVAHPLHPSRPAA